MNTYKAFFQGKQIEVKADTSYEAQQVAVKIFKAKKSWSVTVMLVAKGEVPVIHSTASL